MLVREWLRVMAPEGDQAAAGDASAAPAQSAAPAAADAKPADAAPAADAKPAADQAADAAKPAADAAKPADAKPADAKPVVPEKYEFKAAKDVTIDAEMVAGLEAVAKELGLSQENAQKVFDLGANLTKTIEKRAADAHLAQATKWADEARADKEFGGEKFQESLALAAKAREAIATPGLLKFLDSTKLGNHPDMMRMFVRVGRMIAEDKVVQGGRDATSQTSAMASRLFPTSKA